MKRFLFAVAVVAMSVTAAMADDKPATGTPTTPPTGMPGVVTTTPTVTYSSAQPARRGLLGRLFRNRNTTNYSYTPLMSVPSTTPTTTPPTTTPEPMPGTRPVGGMIESGTYVMTSYEPTQTRRGLFGRFRNRGTTTTSSMMVATSPMPMMPMPMPMPGTTTPPQPLPGSVVQATGDLPPGQYTTTDGTIIQIGGTQPMTSTSTERRGLFSRLRNR